MTSLNIDLEAVATGPGEIFVVAAVPGNPCTAIQTIDQSYLPTSRSSEEVQIPSGVVIGTGHDVGVVLRSDSGDSVVQVQVHGYLVASTLCTVTGPPVGCL